MGDPLPAGGLAAYVDRVRKDHIRLKNGRCSCDEPLCSKRWLLDYIDQLTATGEERDEAVRLLKSCTGMGDELSHAERVQVLRSQLAQALRERDDAREYTTRLVLQATGSWPGWGDEVPAAFEAADKEIDKLRAGIARLTRERDEAQAAIRDIDAHATPIGLLHEDDPEGSPHHYIVTVGALHRALGKSNGTGVKCDVERDLLRWLHAEALYHRDFAHQMLERMETQHITWGVLGTTEEIHPDWCRECRVDKLRAELGAVQTDGTALIARWEQLARPNIGMRGRGEAMLECARQLWLLLGQPHTETAKLAATSGWAACLDVPEFETRFGQILCDEHSPVAVRVGDQYLPVVDVEAGETVDGGHTVVAVAGEQHAVPATPTVDEDAEQ